MGVLQGIKKFGNCNYEYELRQTHPGEAKERYAREEKKRTK